MTPVGIPDGFTLVLPDDWVKLDLDPETAESSRKLLVDAMVRDDPSVADQRDDIEALLSAAADAAAEDGALLCALRFDVDPEGSPVQATVLVAVRAIEGSSDPAALHAELQAAGIEAQVVDLAAGPALRLDDRTAEGMLTFSVLLPIPGVDGRIAMLSLFSPSLSHEAQLGEFFDALANTFAFTGEADQETVG